MSQGGGLEHITGWRFETEICQTRHRVAVRIQVKTRHRVAVRIHDNIRQSGC